MTLVSQYDMNVSVMSSSDSSSSAWLTLLPLLDCPCSN